MAPPLAIPDTIVKLSSKFDIFTTVYKTIGKNSITVDILIPKDIQPGKYPLLIRFHGGGLVRSESRPLRDITAHNVYRLRDQAHT